MIFNSYVFLLIFLPAILCVFFYKRMKPLREYTIIISSLIFYSYSSIEHTAILLLNIIIVYFIVSQKKYKGNKILFILSITLPLISLIYYKYLYFIISHFTGEISQNKDISHNFSLFDDALLPAGISFFTFQLISFSIDRYKESSKPLPTFKQFALYIGFFPQLVAGPIVRYDQVGNQISSIKKFSLTNYTIDKSLSYFITGLSLKVLIADNIYNTISPIIHNPEQGNFILGAYTIFAYSFQIYFDFYGYSLMAIGLGILFGIRLPVNFDRPYISKNPKEFWRRWHITLSFWIRDYLYIPLGGNLKYIRNIIIIFALAGAWHGAGWNFIIWGIIHGALAALYHWQRKYWDCLPVSVQRVGTFSVISIIWLLFLFDFEELRIFITSLTNMSANANLPNPTGIDWVLIAISAGIAFGLDLNSWLDNPKETKYQRGLSAVTLALLFVLSFMLLDTSDSFIYFRF